MRLCRGVLAWHTALASSRQSALCVFFDLHATLTGEHEDEGGTRTHMKITRNRSPRSVFLALRVLRARR